MSNYDTMDVRPDARAGTYAGFAPRLGAQAVDGLIFLIVLALCGGAIGFAFGLVGWADRLREEDPAWTVFALVAAWLYTAIGESGPRQATWGKRLFGLQVADANGRRIGFGRASARFFLRYLSMLPLLLGYFMQPFTARRQALHDLLASTVVLDTRERGVRTGRVPRGLGAMVAAGVLLVAVGATVAVALPAYRDYTVRTGIAEVMVAASQVRQRAERFMAAHETTSMSLQDLGFPPGALATRGATLSLQRGGVVKAELGAELSPSKQHAALLWAPFVDAQKAIAWACGAEGVPDKYLPSSCRADTLPPGLEDYFFGLAVTRILESYPVFDELSGAFDAQLADEAGERMKRNLDKGLDKAAAIRTAIAEMERESGTR
jgi:uncharacterized RDD family membrane protein YckC/Tfp pilus assembly major pilin PilA